MIITTSLRFALLLGAGLCCFARASELSGTDSVQQTVKAGDAAFAHGSYDSARQSFEKAWQIAQGFPADAPIRYEILKRLSATSVASGQFAQANVYLQRALEWHESILGTKDSKILADLLLSINLDLRTKNFDRALATAKRIQEMDIAAHTADSLPVADSFLRIGQICLAERKPQDAVHALQKAYALRTKLAGPLDPGLLPILDGLNEGFRAIVGGPGTGTESSYKQALMIRETLYGEESSELISTIEWLAETYVAEGQYLAAEPLYDRLLSLWEKLAGKDHPMVAITLDKLAALYLKEGKADKARELSARSITIRARFLAVSLLHQAVDAISAGDPAQARVLCSRALAALGPPDPANEDLIAQIRKTLLDTQKASVR